MIDHVLLSTRRSSWPDHTDPPVVGKALKGIRACSRADLLPLINDYNMSHLNSSLTHLATGIGKRGIQCFCMSNVT